MEEFETSSCIHGFHVYQDTWTLVISEQLICRREDSKWPFASLFHSQSILSR